MAIASHSSARTVETRQRLVRGEQRFVLVKAPSRDRPRPLNSLSQTIDDHAARGGIRRAGFAAPLLIVGASSRSLSEHRGFGSGSSARRISAARRVAC